MLNDLVIVLSTLIIIIQAARGSAVDGCNLLANQFPELIITNTSSKFTSENQHFYSQSCILNPRCIFVPETSQQIGQAIKIIDTTNSDFAVRSGGHSTSVGFANTDSGVLIALDNFNQVTVSDDRKTISVGPGQTWQRVFDTLTPLNLTVVGGRLGPVGVGGLILGGGLGYQANELGLACDNVINYEIITGDGEVRNVNGSSHADLFGSLKGGSSAFGIVTRFDIMAHELGTIWAGVITYNITLLPQLINAYAGYISHEPDPKSHLIFSVLNAPSLGGRTVSLTLYYGSPLSAPPSSFAPFFDIPFLSNTVTNTNLSAFAFQQGEDDNGTVRSLFRAVSYKPSEEMNTAAVAIWENITQSLSLIDGFLLIHAFQPISRAIQTPRNGGNVLGLNPNDGLIQWTALTFRWSNPADDDRVHQSMVDATNQIGAEAKRQGRSVNFIFLNDAGGDQPVYQSYGQANFERLQSLQKAQFNNFKVFNQLQNGHFSL